MCRRRICAVERTLVRVFAVFAVLTGVLFVHGFSGAHDLNGGVAAAKSIQVSLDAPEELSPTHDHGDGRYAANASPATPAHAMPGGAGPGAAGDHGGHGDAHTCLALLTVSALMLVGMIAGLRASRPARMTAGARAHLRSRAQALTRPPAPNLSLLCVSRT